MAGPRRHLDSVSLPGQLLRSPWGRTNHRGRQVSLLAGPAVALGAGLLTPVPYALPLAVLAAVVGRYDDVAGDRPEQRADKGLAGHLRALGERRISSGTVKALVLPVAGLLAAAARADARSWPQLWCDALLIASAANTVNLLDVAPGRALKATLAVLFAAAALPPVRRAGLGLAVVAAAAMPADLAERTMLGDCGANALGALLGLCLAADRRWAVRLPALSACVAVTLAAERVSLSAVIARQPALARLDAWGRPA